MSASFINRNYDDDDDDDNSTEMLQVTVTLLRRLIELRFNIPLNTKKVISEMLFPANTLAITEILRRTLASIFLPNLNVLVEC